MGPVWGRLGSRQADWRAGLVANCSKGASKHGTVTLETRVSFTMNHYVCSSVECSCSLGLG